MAPLMTTETVKSVRMKLRVLPRPGVHVSYHSFLFLTIPKGPRLAESSLLVFLCWSDAMLLTVSSNLQVPTHSAESHGQCQMLGWEVGTSEVS